MADIKETVKKMIEQGLGEEEIKANLSELGFANADAIVKEALSGGKPKQAESEKPAEQPSGKELGFSMTSIGAEGDEKELKFESAGEGGTLFSEHKELNAGRIEEKLDDAIALLKSIQDLNKKLLKANQDLAAKIK